MAEQPLASVDLRLGNVSPGIIVKIQNPMTEDLFEAARKAFFGTGDSEPGALLLPATPKAK